MNSWFDIFLGMWFAWVPISAALAVLIVYAWRKAEVVFGWMPSSMIRAMLRVDTEALSKDGKKLRFGPDLKYRMAAWLYLNTIRRIKGEPAKWKSAVGFFSKGYFAETVTNVRAFVKKVDDVLHKHDR